MKVRNFIAYLNRNYSPDQEIMGFAIGSEFKEMKAELWEQAVEIWDDEDVRATFQDYINDIIIDAEIQLYQVVVLQKDIRRLIAFQQKIIKIGLGNFLIASDKFDLSQRTVFERATGRIEGIE